MYRRGPDAKDETATESSTNWHDCYLLFVFFHFYDCCTVEFPMSFFLKPKQKSDDGLISHTSKNKTVQIHADDNRNTRWPGLLSARLRLQMLTIANICAPSCSFRAGNADMRAWMRCGAPVKTRDRLFIASEASSAQPTLDLFYLFNQDEPANRASGFLYFTSRDRRG